MALVAYTYAACCGNGMPPKASPPNTKLGIVSLLFSHQNNNGGKHRVPVFRDSFLVPPPVQPVVQPICRQIVVSPPIISECPYDWPLVDANGDKLICGRDILNGGCPSGSECVIGPNSAYYVCCSIPVTFTQAYSKWECSAPAIVEGQFAVIPSAPTLP